MTIPAGGDIYNMLKTPVPMCYNKIISHVIIIRKYENNYNNHAHVIVMMRHVQVAHYKIFKFWCPPKCHNFKFGIALLNKC